MSRPHLRLVASTEAPAEGRPDGPSMGEDATKFVPIRLLLALSGRCDCTDCCAVELARRAGRAWVHPDVRESRPALRAVR